MVATANMCLYCKGSKFLCGNRPCPLIAKFNVKPKIDIGVNKDFFGPATSIFVGHYGYPNVFVGPMAAIETRKDIDNPGAWYGKEYSEIIEMRSLLLRSKYKQNIKSKEKFIQDNKDLALAKNAADVEMEFKKKPIYNVTFSDMHQPHGPVATLNTLNVIDNIKVAKVVDKTVNDEIKAAEAAEYMYSHGQNIYKITTILSSGALGLEKNQKLVPTRWSITAIDDILFKHMVPFVKDCPSINEFEIYESKFLDNHFIILLMPGNWEYEGFEAWAPGTPWAQDQRDAYVIPEFETYKGRTKYADKQAGGYYAARFGVVEALHRRKRQAGVVVFREVHKGYNIPLGVWQVRENVRKAMENKIAAFNAKSKALDFINLKLKLPLSKYVSCSTLLKQKRLQDFF